MNRLRKIAVTMVVTLLAGFAPAFAQTVEWTTTYEGLDWLYGLVADESENVYVLGSTLNVYGNVDYLVFKLDRDGVIQWTRSWNADDGWLWSSDIAVDAAGNVHVAGYSSFNPTQDYFTVKYDTNGTLEWTAEYASADDAAEIATAIALDDAGNVFVTGYSLNGSNADPTTVKYDSDGVEQWARRYDGGDTVSFWGADIATDSAGNAYVAGNSDYDAGILLKYASDGTQFLLDSIPDARFLQLAVEPSGALVVAGSISGADDTDSLVVRYEADGSQDWFAVYDGPDGLTDLYVSVALDAAGNIVLAGMTETTLNGEDVLAASYTASGAHRFVGTTFDQSDSDDRSRAVGIDHWGNTYVTGDSSNGSDFDVVTIKYDSVGDVVWTDIYDDPVDYINQGRELAVDVLGNAYVGANWYGGGSNIGAVTKYSSCACVIDEVCYDDGDVNPANPCQSCDSDTDPAGWTNDDTLSCDDGNLCTHSDSCDGGTCTGTPYSCDDDGLECTDEVCVGDGTCDYPVLTGYCLIEGACLFNYQVNPENDCLFCMADNETDWTPMNGIFCDDGLFCNGEDMCNGGSCSVHGGSPCPEGYWCSEDANECFEDEEPSIASVEFTPRAAGDVGLDAFIGGVVSFEVVVGSTGGFPITSYHWQLRTYPDLTSVRSWSTVTATTNHQFLDGGAYLLTVVVSNSGGYDSDPASPTNALGENEPIDVGSASAPVIEAFVADDPDNGDTVYSDGDVFLVQFDVATDRAGFGGAVLSKSAVDGLFNCSQSLGLDYEGTWTADDEFTITVLTATTIPLAPVIGSTPISAVASGGIRVAGGASLPSSSLSPPLTGDYGDQSDCACVIDGGCYFYFQFNPSNDCEACDPGMSQTEWTPMDGSYCDDGLFCNGMDMCNGNACTVHEGFPCPEGYWCSEDADQCFEDEQTGIELVSFEAEADEFEVLLTWETASETENAGFHLWRSRVETGGYERVTTSLIPAEGDAFTGASYEWTDGTVSEGTYFYKLEDIDVRGQSTFHGPVSATIVEEPFFGCGG